MKLGKLRKDPELIKRAEWHLDLDRILCSRFTWCRIWPIPMHWLFVPFMACFRRRLFVVVRLSQIAAVGYPQKRLA